jgi:hypothetical protein
VDTIGACAAAGRESRIASFEVNRSISALRDGGIDGPDLERDSDALKA